ncbi:SpaA isopeptide-forming pilin-related protein [Enterococcus sp.]|uniref:SpaA isopeptide-forming pilin-related protein n=1 Tax=Enterococcus sp. TaxID=35783 RepID=UPI00290A421A|nr:SpaA isopeptide-forming pilin-related protein [Enterococcus sp.]MDU5336191.1 SpaA isopeptide-forming pilin-related protein [Enterococcus sp.]
MKKSNIFILILLLFSIIFDASLAIVTTHAESKEIELADEKRLKLSYIYEEEEENYHWQIKYQRQSEEKEEQQRLKFKITDEKDQTIDYPKLEHLEEKDGWLIEKEFSAKEEGKLSLKLSQSIKQLNLYVQMDQQKEANDPDDKDSEIEKDILEREEPYLLEATKQATKTSSSKEKTEESKAVTTSSEKFVGPKTKEQLKAESPSVATTAGMNSMYANSYENKVPDYKTDATGKYPEFSWQPTGQTNVINHQGGRAGQTGWDNEANWNVGWDDFSKSYIKYGESNNENIQIRKYAQQTDDPEKFKIKLNVRGNTTYKPGVDIVFLLDNSQSMDSDSGIAGTNQKKRKENAEIAFKHIVDNLKSINVPEAENIRIGAEIFSDYSDRNSWGGRLRPNASKEKRKFQLSKNPADWDKIVAEYSTKDMATGVTFTQRGLQEAKDIFDASPSSDRHKLLFVLTDGAPNRSWTTSDSGTSNLDIFPDPRYFRVFNKGTKPNYNEGSSLHSSQEVFTTTINPPYNNRKITSHITTTNSTAMDLKNSGIEIHTIALKLMVNYNEPGYSNGTARQNQIRGLYKMSTKKANATNGPTVDTADDYHFYDVENGDDLTSYFDSWYETIIRTVDKGVITDPLGDMVELVDDPEPQVRQVLNGKPRFTNETKPSISPESNDRVIKVSNINLSRNQEIEVEYTVRLKTTDDAFVSGRWYPANGRTTLEPTPERTNDVLDFGVPSVRYQKEDFVIPVEKIWSDKYQGTDNYWGLRPNKINVTLQRANGSNWSDVETKELNESNQWKTDFSAVEGGADNTYRVVETTRVSGYKAPVINQASFTSENIISGGIKITNELLKETFQFSKFMEDGTTAFGQDKPKFSMKRESDGKTVATNLEPNASGKVTVPDVPKGNYIIKETYVPAGYKEMPEFVVNVTENNPPTSLVFKVNNRTEEHHALNELKDFTLRVEKVDSGDNPLTGAVFKLTGPNYDRTINTGSVFTFANLRPGVYTLTEIDNPEGYKRIQDPIGFIIGVGGKVTVNSHPNVSGSGGINGGTNTINLKVTNEKVRPGTLPSTGDYGIKGFFLIAGVLSVLGIAIGSFCIYSMRKEIVRNTEKMNGRR